MECVILQWWAAREATFPTVSKMAIQYLGAPASLLHLLQLRGCSPVLVGIILRRAAQDGTSQA